MATILHISTAEETASVCISDDRAVLGEAINDNQKDHAAWIHGAIRDLADKAGLSMQNIDAVSVSIGPGSYTGLRVGLSAAKGFCYALNIPLITIGTLKIIAYAGIEKHKTADIICPVIDARRMEIYTAIYDKRLTEIKKPHSVVVDENSFVDLISTHKVLFCGNGSAKLKNMLTNENLIFDTGTITAVNMRVLAHDSYHAKDFAALAYTEPLYIKEFYSPYRKPSI